MLSDHPYGRPIRVTRQYTRSETDVPRLLFESCAIHAVRTAIREAALFRRASVVYTCTFASLYIVVYQISGLGAYQSG